MSHEGSTCYPVTIRSASLRLGYCGLCARFKCLGRFRGCGLFLPLWWKVGEGLTPAKMACCMFCLGKSQETRNTPSFWSFWRPAHFLTSKSVPKIVCIAEAAGDVTGSVRQKVVQIGSGKFGDCGNVIICCIFFL